MLLYGLHLQKLIIFGSVILALSVIMIRIKAAKKPASVMKIIMPPIGMSSGFMMFLFPEMRIPILWGILSFIIGAVFLAYPLIITSKFHVVKGKIYLRRSKAFVWILLGLLVLRVILHSYVQSYISLPQTGAVFFILAFGMLLPWRIVMYVRYRRVEQELMDDDSINNRNIIIAD